MKAFSLERFLLPVTRHKQSLIAAFYILFLKSLNRACPSSAPLHSFFPLFYYLKMLFKNIYSTATYFCWTLEKKRKTLVKRYQKQNKIYTQVTFLLTLFGTEVAKMNKNLLYFLVFICNIVVMRGKKVEMHRTFSQESFLFFSSYQVK